MDHALVSDRRRGSVALEHQNVAFVGHYFAEAIEGLSRELITTAARGPKRSLMPPQDSGPSCPIRPCSWPTETAQSVALRSSCCSGSGAGATPRDDGQIGTGLRRAGTLHYV